MEDFIDGDDEEKNKIFDAYIKAIWASSNRRTRYKKYINVKVADRIKGTPVGDMFERYSKTSYDYFKRFTKSDSHVDIVRQKINNLYTSYCDEKFCTNGEYMRMLKWPRILYSRYMNGEDMTPEYIEEQVKTSRMKADTLYEENAKQKLKLSWAEYRKLVKDFLWTIFCNAKVVGELEDDVSNIHTELITEDNVYIRYVCKSLNGKMQNYQKNHYNMPIGHGTQYSRCQNCGALIVQNTAGTRLYCDTCAAHLQREAVRSAQNYQGDTVRYGHCTRCGKQIVQNKNGDRKYCDECAAEVHRDEMRSGRGYIGDEVKHGTCVECGAEITYEKNASRKYCDDCARKIKNKQNRESRARLKALVD